MNKDKIDYNWSKKFWENRIKQNSKTTSLNLGTTIQQHNIQFNELMNVLDNQDKFILDLGCGVGRLTIPLSYTAYGITGVDFSESNIAYLKDKVKHNGIDNVELFCQSVYTPIKNRVKAYDTILIFGVLLHLNNNEIKTLLAVARDYLTDNGKVIVRESVGVKKPLYINKFCKELDSHYMAYYRTPQDIETKFELGGFIAPISKELYQQRKETGTYMWMFKKW